MKNRALIGAGGFADEVKASIGEPNMISFVSDDYFTGSPFTRKLSEFNPDEWEVLVAIGDSNIRKNIVKGLPPSTKFFTHVHPSVVILENIDVNHIIGEGSVICAGSIITTNVKIGKHSHLNLQTTIGHDCRIGDYFTTAPGTKISGNNKIGERVYFGTNSSTKQYVDICDNVTVGLNGGVVKNIDKSGVYVGTPAKKL